MSRFFQTKHYPKQVKNASDSENPAIKNLEKTTQKLIILNELKNS